ncbi:hypothetical protein SDJN02_10730, partial [Cucurbita argyrosperma subsp. argyrosperma]
MGGRGAFYAVQPSEVPNAALEDGKKNLQTEERKFAAAQPPQYPTKANLYDRFTLQNKSKVLSRITVFSHRRTRESSLTPKISKNQLRGNHGEANQNSPH